MLFFVLIKGQRGSAKFNYLSVFWPDVEKHVFLRLPESGSSLVNLYFVWTLSNTLKQNRRTKKRTILFAFCLSLHWACPNAWISNDFGKLCNCKRPSSCFTSFSSASAFASCCLTLRVVANALYLAWALFEYKLKNWPKDASKQREKARTAIKRKVTTVLPSSCDKT